MFSKEEFKKFTAVYSCGRLSSLFDGNGVPFSGDSNFVSIPMFYLCFNFFSTYPPLTSDKPKAAWKFLLRIGFPVDFMGQIWASWNGLSCPRQGSGPPEARGPSYPSLFPGKHSVLILFVMVLGLQLKSLTKH